MDWRQKHFVRIHTDDSRVDRLKQSYNLIRLGEDEWTWEPILQPTAPPSSSPRYLAAPPPYSLHDITPSCDDRHKDSYAQQDLHVLLTDNDADDMIEMPSDKCNGREITHTLPEAYVARVVVGDNRQQQRNLPRYRIRSNIPVYDPASGWRR